MQNGTLYAISELFTSIQGEGVYVGQLQTFIRLAGCTVGKPYRANERGSLPIYTEKCRLYDGRSFPCDTDYRKKEKLTAEQIVQHIPDDVDDVCITGGEPLMHDLSALITYLWGVGRRIHIETSGTIYATLHSDIWVTVSPKYGVLESMLDRANEVKLLVDENFNLDNLIGLPGLHPYNLCDIRTLALKKPVFLQPVNFENDVNADNMQLCLEYQRRCPALRVSLQLHKVLSMYVKEKVL